MLLRCCMSALLVCLASGASLLNDLSQDLEAGDYDYQYVNDNPIVYMNDNPIVEVDDSGTPVCPPTGGLFNAKWCSAKKCQSDTDCMKESGSNSNSDMACCFNGCVKTCMLKIPPPPVFDWDEEDDIRDQGPMGREILEAGEFQGPEVAVTLPGGCRLTEMQYQSFQNFDKNPNIKKCYCKDGNVVCDVTVDHKADDAKTT